MEDFALSRPVTERVLEDIPPVSTELLGTQTRFVHGERYRHRIIEAGDPGMPPLMLLHGIGGHAECWARNMRNLGKHFHVIAPDMLFHGYSSHEPWDRERWVSLIAEGLVDLIDAMGWERANVQGESLGGHVAFNLGLRFPGRVERLVLNTGLPRVRFPGEEVITRPGGKSNLSGLSKSVVAEPTFEKMAERMKWLVSKPERMTEEMISVRLNIYSEPEINKAMHRVYGVGCEGPALPVYDPEEVAKLSPKTLVFWSEHNPEKGPSYARRIAALIPNAKMYVMADAGHWPQWEKPLEHDQVLIEFLLGE